MALSGKTAAVIQAMIEIRKGFASNDQRAEKLGLEPEELAFYDEVVKKAGDIYDDPFLCGLIHKVVKAIKAIKANLKIDWTEPHREDAYAGVKASVKRVLLREGVEPEDFGTILPFVMKQAEAMYREWPLAA